jgi:hypothetical protein
MRSANRTDSRFTFGCGAVVVVLMVVESAIGLFVRDVYPEATWAVAALRGNDLVTLVLVAPVLAVALVRGRQSAGWSLVWLAGVLYGVYNFAYYAFGTAFSDLFLLHVATFSLSILALVGFVMGLDVDAIASRFVAGRRDRVVAAYMVAVGSALVVAWGGLSLRFAVTGRLPEDVMPPSAVHLVYALDLSLLAPSFLAGGLLLWRRRPWGYVLGVAVNLFGVAYLVVLEMVGGFEAEAGVAGKTWVSPAGLVGALACAVGAAVLLRGLGRSRKGALTAVVDADPTTLARSA